MAPVANPENTARFFENAVTKTITIPSNNALLDALKHAGFHNNPTGLALSESKIALQLSWAQEDYTALRQILIDHGLSDRILEDS